MSTPQKQKQRQQQRANKPCTIDLSSSVDHSEHQQVHSSRFKCTVADRKPGLPAASEEADTMAITTAHIVYHYSTYGHFYLLCTYGTPPPFCQQPRTLGNAKCTKATLSLILFSDWSWLTTYQIWYLVCSSDLVFFFVVYCVLLM